MPHSTPPVHLLLALPLRDFATYAEATSILSRVMGKKAPNVLTVIVHTLRCRDARGLVDDYLESVEWPIPAPKAVSAKPRLPQRARPRCPASKCLSPVSTAQTDPGRN